jgi:hypothetical protein
MFNSIQDSVLNLLPPKRKRSQSGWLSFNAVCCSHRGESADTRQRGGVMTQADGAVSYHCFNCQFKTGYQPGRPLGFKFKRWLKWLGADDGEINRLVIEAMRVKDLVKPEQLAPEQEEISFEPRALPEQAQSFMALADFYELNNWSNVPTGYTESVKYVHERRVDMQRYEFFWTPETANKLSHRVIVPFYYKRTIVGWTARAFFPGIKPKYHSNHPANFVFNMDQQLPDNKFVIVCEGPFDAMSVDGVAVMGADISEQQAELIDSLGKTVIVVPDWDGAGSGLIDRAVEYGWAVSFPIWRESCKDINDAVDRYGKLYVLKDILANTESNSLKIKLRSKQ